MDGGKADNANVGLTLRIQLTINCYFNQLPVLFSMGKTIQSCFQCLHDKHGYSPETGIDK